ncbi:MAG: hypothetical protein N3E37_02835 [Candidatus Micrarchaeota archaeon]|nr:hypothetical protein [Candidatus Micrarchaeota archaeon]
MKRTTKRKFRVKKVKLTNVVREKDLALMAKECIKLKGNKPNVTIMNPFKNKYRWTENFVYLEIDVQQSLAKKSSLLFDSVTKKFYRYMDNRWIELIPEIKLKSKAKKDD